MAADDELDGDWVDDLLAQRTEPDTPPLELLRYLSFLVVEAERTLERLRRGRDRVALLCRQGGVSTRTVAAAAGVTGPYVSRLAREAGLPPTRARRRRS